MTGGVTRVGGLPGLLGRVTLSARGTICHVNVRKSDNLPSRGGAHITTRSIELSNSETRVKQTF